MENQHCGDEEQNEMTNHIDSHTERKEEIDRIVQEDRKTGKKISVQILRKDPCGPPKKEEDELPF